MQQRNLGGLLYYLYQGTNLGIYPPLIFLCLGAATDFGPLIANQRLCYLGNAAQFGIFAAFFGAIALGMTGLEAAAVGIIGGADGPTAIYLTTRLAPHLLSVIAIAAYSYMALVPIIQPPIINALTTTEERKIKMSMQRAVTKKERILFPILATIFVALVVPSATTLVGCLMLGNLIRESQVVPKLTETLQNAMMYIVTILLGLTVGAKAEAEIFLSVTSLKIVVMGLCAFAIGTASGVLFGKLMCKLTKGQINPMIGAAGVSAVPMAARVVHKEGLKNDPSNYLLMHAMEMGEKCFSCCGRSVTSVFPITRQKNFSEKGRSFFVSYSCYDVTPYQFGCWAGWRISNNKTKNFSEKGRSFFVVTFLMGP